MWHTWTLLRYTAESCDHGWLTKPLKAAEPDKGHIVASVIKLTALVAHVPNICSERCMGDVHDTVMWPTSPLLFITYKKISFCLVGGWAGCWGGGLIDIYLSCRLEEHQQVKVLNAACLLELINDCLILQILYMDCICWLFFRGGGRRRVMGGKKKKKRTGDFFRVCVSLITFSRILLPCWVQHLLLSSARSSATMQSGIFPARY